MDPLDTSLPTEQQSPEKAVWQKWRPYVRLLMLAAIALVIITPVRMFVAQPFLVSGRSMEPTFNLNDYLVIDKFSLRYREIVRGEVLIFRYPLNQDEYYVKRVVGLPGEQIQVSGNSFALLSKDGEVYDMLSEPYLAATSSTEIADEALNKKPYTVTLDDDEYFMMGDNRLFSSDSRVWGALRKKYIVGRASLRLFPFSRMGINPGRHEY